MCCIALASRARGVHACGSLLRVRLVQLSTPCPPPSKLQSHDYNGARAVQYLCMYAVCSCIISYRCVEMMISFVWQAKHAAKQLSPQLASKAAMASNDLPTSPEPPATHPEQKQAATSQSADIALADDTGTPRPASGAENVEPPSWLQQSAASPKSDQLRGAQASDSVECVVCWEADANVVLQPCGHMCACSGCAALLTDMLCPMCRCEVLSSITLQL